MTTVEIYTTPFCPYCHAAKRLLTTKGRGLHRDRRQPRSVLARGDDARANGRRTVPQIFVGDTMSAGRDDLHALDHAGKLDPLLAG